MNGRWRRGNRLRENQSTKYGGSFFVQKIFGIFRHEVIIGRVVFCKKNKYQQYCKKRRS